MGYLDQWEQERAEEIAAPLIGKTIVGVDVNLGEEALRFRLQDGSTVVWATDGDCCSESWWADILGLDEVRSPYDPGENEVKGVKALQLPEPMDARSRQEVDAVYGFELKADWGSAKFIFRNSSNGYYGGSAYVREDNESDEWREITGDTWSA